MNKSERISGGGKGIVLKMIGLTRSSTQEVAEGYGPAIQKSELLADAKSQDYDLAFVRNIVEPATINLEERELFNEVMSEAVKLKRESKCDGLCFSRCDRLSRRFDAALQIALDCKKHGLALRFVRENQWLRPEDEPMPFVLFVLQAFGVHTQTGISMANMNAGRLRAAAAGKLPAGIGYGMHGYSLANKKFTTTSFIVVVDEILERASRGDSINQITRDLIARGIRTSSGKVITRSAVAVILRHARRYAGIWDWHGYEIRNLIPPRITEEQAENILANLKRNREHSYGFGKRKWLTSRVICGLCGRKYNLRIKQGCACPRTDPLMASPPCSNVRMSWKDLSEVVWQTFVECISGLGALEWVIDDKRKAWKAQKKKTEQQVRDLQEQLARLQQKKRQYSWQQAEGILTNDELLSAHKLVKSEESVLNEQIKRLEDFWNQPAPPSKETFKKFGKFWGYDVIDELSQADDEMKARFAELFELYATVQPDTYGGRGYHVDLSANVPLEIEGKKPSAYDMVFSSSRGGLRG